MEKWGGKAWSGEKQQQRYCVAALTRAHELVEVVGRLRPVRWLGRSGTGPAVEGDRGFLVAHWKVVGEVGTGPAKEVGSRSVASPWTVAEE
jgi:hypothetical protein